MAEQKQDDQLEHTYSGYVRIWDVALKTCQRRWTIVASEGQRYPCWWHDDDDDMHNTDSILENETHKTLCDFVIQTDHLILAKTEW